MPTNNRAAGALRNRLTFQSRGQEADGWGGEPKAAGAFVDRFTVWAAMKPLHGSEAVQAARLTGRQPYIVTVRQSSDTRQIKTGWRIEDARQPGRYLNITALSDPDGQRAWLEILATEGEGS
jgi:SPP1 family predicted phage head-tail adaptor